MSRHAQPVYAQQLYAASRAGRAPMELLPGMAAAGFIGLPVPAGYGGTGGGAADVRVLLEEFGRASLSIAPFLNRALADGDNFVIGGSKMFTSGTAESPCLIVSARTDPGATRQRGISVFLVDAKTLGITCRRIEKLGMRTAGTLCEVEYRGLRVPRSVLLGGLDQGWQVITGTLERARLAQAAYCAGGAQQAIDDALAHVRERSALAHSQALAHMLVGLQMRTDAARLLTHRASAMVDAGQSCVREAPIANRCATETLVTATSEALRVWGAAGLTPKHRTAPALRDARLFIIGDDSSQIQRNLIVRQMSL